MKRNGSSLKTSLFQGKPWYQSRTNSFLSSILSITADIIQHFPQTIRNPLIKSIDKLGLFIIRMMKIMPFHSQPYHHIQGPGVENEQINIMYQGDLPSIIFFLKKLFPDNKNLHITTIPYNKNKKKIAALKEKSDMFIIEKDYFFKGFYQKKGYLIIPENISFILPAIQPIENTIKKCSQSIQQDIKKAKSFGYQYEIKSDISAFKNFYNTMYIPYVKWKYKEMEKIVSYNAMRHFSLRGSKLLLVTSDDSNVFGGIFDIEKQKIITQYAGLKEGKFNHIHNGIITLSYYFLILIAKKYNIKSIDFGTSPPFLSDGLYKYKMKWNMHITKTKPIFSTIFAIKMNAQSKSLQNFFKQNPFFYYKKDSLSAAFLIDTHNDITKKEKWGLKHNNLKEIEPTLYYSLDELYL